MDHTAVWTESRMLVPLATDGAGTIGVQSGSAGTVHLVLDVNGCFQPE